MDGLLYWLVIGLIAGWLAGVVMKGGGYGIVMDIVLGVVGGIVGGWLFSALGIGAGSGAIGGIIVAFVGAVILVALTRVLKRAAGLRAPKTQARGLSRDTIVGW
jgi:uncharacterized membrane protein YeaQ/YmgE (transglycosylase-associated protein family)